MRLYRGTRTKLDKVFDNTYHEAHCPYFDTVFLKFKIEYTNNNEEDNIHKSIIFNDMINYIYKKCYHMNKHIKYNNLDQIESIFLYFESIFKTKYNLIDIWYFILYYFDITPRKLYNAISLTHKEKLVNELYHEDFISEKTKFLLIENNKNLKKLKYIKKIKT